MDKITPGNYYKITYEEYNVKAAQWGHIDSTTVIGLCTKIQSRPGRFNKYTFYTLANEIFTIYHYDLEEVQYLHPALPLGQILYGS